LHGCRADEPWSEDAADERRRNDDVGLRALFREQLALPPTVLVRQLFRISAARRCALLELDADIFGADAFDLLLDFRPDVGRDHIRAKTTGGRDGLEAGDAGADDEHLCRPDHPG